MFTDYYSHESHIYLLSQKDQVFNTFKNFETWLETHHPNTKIKYLRSDRGGEYTSDEFTRHLQAKGIIRELTVHDTPEQNGVSERLNRTILEHARAMLMTANLPRILWGEAMKHAIWLKNRSPSKAIALHTPYFLVYGSIPDLHDLPQFGQSTYVKDLTAGELDS